jgi:hypothetical protein
VRLKDEFLCIIHDKMDHAKIALPRLRMCNKMIFGLGQLPITLTKMITHGHGDERYAQYSNKLWPNDPNFRIKNYYLNTPHRIHYLHVCCKGNCVAYANYTPQIKLLVQSLC